MPLVIIRDDITRLQVDAIVNAANSRLKQGGGVCGAIFRAAGEDKLQAACDTIGFCSTGDAVITEGFSLPARYIIHAVGPVWQGGGHHEEALLRSCYTKALQLALENDFQSAAFPLISSGVYGYPKDQALSVAMSAIGDFLLQHDLMVYLVVYDKKSFQLSTQLFESIQSYLDEHEVIEEDYDRRRLLKNRSLEDAAASIDYDIQCVEEKSQSSSFQLTGELSDVLNHRSESFSQMLLRLINESNKTDPEVYKRANLDRKLFSKIRSHAHYQPSKNTALALAIALELNLDQTADLLQRAGFALSPSSRFDLIVSYFIQAGQYNIFEINEALFAFDESLLGA